MPSLAVVVCETSVEEPRDDWREAALGDRNGTVETDIEDLEDTVVDLEQHKFRVSPRTGLGDQNHLHDRCYQSRTSRAWLLIASFPFPGTRRIA